jgi:hypothetical protein
VASGLIENHGVANAFFDEQEFSVSFDDRGHSEVWSE